MDSQPKTECSNNNNNASNSEANVQLPPELLYKVFSYLPNTDFYACSAVSRYWQSICWNVKLANFIIFLRDFNTNEIPPPPPQQQQQQEQENQQDDVNNDQALQNNGLETKEDEKPVRHVLVEMPVFTVMDHIKKGEVGLEKSTLHYLTISEIIEKLSLVPSGLSVFRMDVSLVLSAGDLENKQVQTLMRKFPRSILELNLRRGSSYLRASDPLSTQTIASTLQVVHQNLQHFSFPIDLATDRIIPNPPFPQLTQLKTLRFRKPVGLLTSPHNGFLIREILKLSPNVSRIHNFPLLLNVDIVRNPVRKCVSNLKAIKSLNYQVSTSKHQYTSALTDLISTDSVNMDVEDDKLKVKQVKENQTHGKICLSKLSIYSWFTDSSSNRSNSNKTFNKILELSKDSLSILKIQPLDFSWEEGPIVIPVLKNLEKITFFDQDRVNRRFFPPISPASQNLDPNDLFPNLKKVVLKLAFPRSWSMTYENKFDAYFPLDTFNPEKEEKERCFHQVTELKLSSSCLHSFPTREVEFKKLGKLFPNVKILELQLRDTEEPLSRLNDVFFLIPEAFIHLEEINIIQPSKELMQLLPDSFIQCLPEMTELRTLQFTFNWKLEMDTTSKPSWLIHLKESLESGILPKLNVCVDFNWTMNPEEVEVIRNIFEPIKSLVIYSAKF